MRVTHCFVDDHDERHVRNEGDRRRVERGIIGKIDPWPHPQRMDRLGLAMDDLHLVETPARHERRSRGRTPSAA